MFNFLTWLADRVGTDNETRGHNKREAVSTETNVIEQDEQDQQDAKIDAAILATTDRIQATTLMLLRSNVQETRKVRAAVDRHALKEEIWIKALALFGGVLLSLMSSVGWYLMDRIIRDYDRQAERVMQLERQVIELTNRHAKP